MQSPQPSKRRERCQPAPPPPPTTIEETGLHPDSLAQLLLKTLMARRDRAAPPGRQAAPAVLGARLAHPARAHRKAGRSPRRDRRRLGRISLHPHGSRARSRRPVPRHLPLRRTGARAALAVQRSTSAPACGPARISIATLLNSGFEHLIVNKTMLDQLGPAVNSGKSLFIYGKPGNGKTVFAEGIGKALGSEMHVPACGRRRRPGHHHVRSGDAPADCRRLGPGERDRSRRAGPPLGK